jgi:hypothetical protein
VVVEAHAARDPMRTKATSSRRGERRFRAYCGIGHWLVATLPNTSYVTDDVVKGDKMLGPAEAAVVPRLLATPQVPLALVGTTGSNPPARAASSHIANGLALIRGRQRAGALDKRAQCRTLLCIGFRRGTMADSIHDKQPAETTPPAGPSADPSVSIGGRIDHSFHTFDLSKLGGRLGPWIQELGQRPTVVETIFSRKFVRESSVQHEELHGSNVNGEDPKINSDDLIDMTLDVVHKVLDVTHMSVDDHASYVRRRLREALGGA